jgi:ATP-dependent Lhr-like helicase
MLEGDRWFASEATRDPKEVLRGRMEALGPVFFDDPLLLELEGEGAVLRGRFEGRQGWCNRRLLARIHRYTLERLRKEIEPVSAADLLRFLISWQHIDEERRLEGPRGVSEVIDQLAGFEVPAAAWEGSVLPARIRDYRREWLDQVTLSGEVAWARLWGSAASPIRTTPICLIPREQLADWAALSPAPDTASLTGHAREIFNVLQQRGAMFPQELARASRLLKAQLELGLGELVARGLVTCDSFAGLRALIVPASRRRHRMHVAGRWSLLPRDTTSTSGTDPRIIELIARQQLKRTGVVFRRTLLREKQPFGWRELLRVLRTLEARGEVRGGRFVSGFEGEQYALPEAVTLLRSIRRREPGATVHVSAGDPLNFRGILTPDERISPMARKRVLVA